MKSLSILFGLVFMAMMPVFGASASEEGSAAVVKKPSEYIFDRKDLQRRDPFYSVVETLKAEQKIKEIKEGVPKDGGNNPSEENGPSGLPVAAADAHPTEAALEKARYYADRAEFELLNGKWAISITESEAGLKVLKTAEVAPQFKEQINTLNLLLNGFRTTAKDAQLNEAAEAKFNALRLEVQGIMWSADKRSLAIISGEAYFVQDKIGDENDAVTIVNIDPNRVDFMINHQRKRFEFKRYIDN